MIPRTSFSSLVNTTKRPSEQLRAHTRLFHLPPPRGPSHKAFQGSFSCNQFQSAACREAGTISELPLWVQDSAFVSNSGFFFFSFSCGAEGTPAPPYPLPLTDVGLHRDRSWAGLETTAVQLGPFKAGFVPPVT